MNSKRDGGELLQAREADARLGARVRRASLLWWAAANVILCLLNFTTEPQKAWPTDLVGYAGGSFAGLGWSLLIARRLTYERRRLRREAVWEGLGLAVLGGCICGLVAGAFNLCVANSLKISLPVPEQVAAFAAFSGDYAELCVGWCFIYFVISGAERVARIEEKVSALRVVAYESQSALIRSELRMDFMRTVFSELEGLLSLRKQPESQGVVVSVAAQLRRALDRSPDATGSADCPEVNAAASERGEAEFGAPDMFVAVVLKMHAANAIFWIAIFTLFYAVMGSCYAVINGEYWLWNLVGWFAFSVAGYLTCVGLGPASAFLAAKGWWEKCAWAAVFSIVASYLSAWVPWAMWGLYGHGLPSIQVFLDFAFYYGCAYACWYCLYFYAQAVRSEVTQRAVLAQAAEAAAAARNSMLRYQVRPHFLFNALNALYTLIADRRWTAARSMTRALSEYLERAFAEDGRELVPIGEQLEALQAYLGIEKIRFGNRLRFRAEVPEALAGACAPSLILHPLIENAMKYAVAATADPVEVEIAADRVGDTLLLRIRDSGGDPEAPGAPGLGIGLRNVAARLAGHYGERGSLRCKRLTPKGFVAEIRLPLEFACTPSAA